jgi:hypothetical protein
MERLERNIEDFARGSTSGEAQEGNLCDFFENAEPPAGRENRGLVRQTGAGHLVDPFRHASPRER